MWLPETFGQAFPLALLSLVCWGSWSNTAKEAARLKVPFAHFYADWCLAGFVTAVFAWIILGNAEIAAEAGTDPTTDVHVGRHRVLAAVAAGAIFNVANALLVVGINLAGLSVAFPMGIGTALVLGTILTYFVDSDNRPGKPELLFAGVGLGFIAVVAIAAADHFLRGSQSKSGANANKSEASAPLVTDSQVVNDAEKGGSSSNSSGFTVPPSPDPAFAGKPSQLTSAGICLGAGLLMSCWAPLSSYSMNNNGDVPDGLNPYASFLLYMAAVLVTSQKPSPLAIFLVQSPLDVSQRTTPSVYYNLTLKQHSLGWAGGVLWAIGTLSNLISGNTVGVALAYAVGQSAPMVATGWGVFYYKEFNGAPNTAWGCLVAMVALYGGAIALIASSNN